MRLLKKQAKRTEQKLLAENTENYDALVRAHYPAPAKKRNVLPFAILGGIGALAVALTLCLVFLLPNTAENSKLYKAENRQVADCTVEEINTSLKSMQLDTIPNYFYHYSHTYDTQYNETLYYEIEIENDTGIVSSTVRLYTNPDYSRQDTISENAITQQVGGFTILYNKRAVEDGGLYTVSYTAESQVNDVVIFITYQQLSLDDTGDFFNFFAQTFSKK